MSADTLLARLEGVRQSGRDQWTCKCPAHEDRSPSLSVRELDDGRVLVHDFGGCDPADIMTALGLSMSDLFPNEPHRRTSPRQRWDGFALLKVLRRESVVTSMAAVDLATGRALSEPDRERLQQAAKRIQQITGVIDGR